MKGVVLLTDRVPGHLSAKENIIHQCNQWKSGEPCVLPKNHEQAAKLDLCTYQKS